jgi:alpha-tubulin suppressor-like RCC1 family protein
VEGQLGDGTFDYRDYPTLPVVGIDDARAIAAGIRFTCAVRSDGTVWCWGEDPGNGPSTSVPRQVPNIDNATSVVAGGAFACALRSSGAIACWGVNDIGEFGDGTFESNVGAADPQAVVGIDDATQIAAGWNHACAVRSDHSLWCWGGNGDGATGYGQLGNGTLDNSAIPVEVTAVGDVSAVAAGGWTTCAIRTDGTVWCWGYGEQGGLGDGNATNSSTPIQAVGITDATLLTVGDYHACATRSDGITWCWGDTDWAGSGPATTPVEGNNSSGAVPTQIATGGHQYLEFIDQNGQVWNWGFGGNQAPERWPIGP